MKMRASDGRTWAALRERARGQRGYTLVEVMVVLLIIAIGAALSIDTIAAFDAQQRAERAARNCVAFTRYARSLAMTTGTATKLSINTGAGSFGVYTQTGTSTWALVTQSLIGSGPMTITMSARRDLVGTTMSVSPSGTTDFIYTQLGACSTSGTLTFTCAGSSKTMTIPAVGDPVVN